MTELAIEGSDVIARMEELRSEINHHRFLYYVLDRPTISDAEFDVLFRELQDLESKNPDLIIPDSPTQTVGAKPSTEFKQVRHRIPMLSLANAMGDEDLDRWQERIARVLELSPEEAKKLRYVCELKIDGLSIALTYKQGKLVEGATRGNGDIGEDVTLNLKTINEIPHTLTPDAAIKVPDLLEVRGEVYFPISSFNALNKSIEEEGDQPFANPRNAASGSLRQKDPRVTAKRKLSAWIYFAYITDAEIPELTEHEASLKYMQSLGLPVNSNRRIATGIDEVKEYCRQWAEKRHSLDYQTDGVVVKLDNRNLWKDLGTTSHSPRWAIAFKYPPDEAETILESVEFDLGRTGAVTPVACLKPVLLAGTTVKRASLHNFDQVERLGVHIGDTVVVRKAGEIIPEVLRVVLEKRPAGAPTVIQPSDCPVCLGPLSKSAEEVVLRCSNYQCPAQVERRLSHFVSRDAMDIEGLGGVLIGQLAQAGLVNDPADLYRLKAEDLLKLDRLGKKSAEKLLSNIEKSKTRPQANLIYALGVKHVGARMAEILAEEFHCLKSLMAVSTESLDKVEGVGPSIAEAIVQFFQNPENAALINRLAEQGVVIEASEADTQREQLEQTLTGKTFVITGTLSMDRAEAEKLIKARGGKATSSVSKKTDYVLAGANPGSKLQKAQELGITVLDEGQFKLLLGVQTSETFSS